jgi:hypothetical protein
VESATVTAIDSDGGTVKLGWMAGLSGRRPWLERTQGDLGREQIKYLFQSEYLIGNYLATGVDASALETAAWDGVGAEARLKLDVGQYAFEWVRNESGLRFVAITRNDQQGRVSIRQEFQAHAEEQSIACEIAHERRTLRPAPEGGTGLEHVTTAVLQQVAFLPEVPVGFTDLDTSGASPVDMATGAVYDDTGVEIGKLMQPGPVRTGPRWARLFAFLGAGLVVGGGAWWWMRRRGAA